MGQHVAVSTKLDLLLLLFLTTAISVAQEVNEARDRQQGQGTSLTDRAPASGSNAASPSLQVSLNTPVSIVNGTQSQVDFGGSFRLIDRAPNLCEGPSWSTTLLLSGNYYTTWVHGSSFPPITVDVFDGTLTVNNRLSEHGPTSFYLAGDILSNSALGLALQQSYGGGFGRVLYSSGCGSNPRKNYLLTVSGDAGMRYVHDRFNAPDKPVDLASAKFGMKLSYIPFRIAKDGRKKEKFAFDMLLWAMPAVNDTRQTQAGGTLAFSAPLAKALTLTVSEEDVYFSHTRKFERKNYARSAVSFSYSFPGVSPP